MAKASRAPWKRQNPRKRAGKASKHLSPTQKSAAKARARRAGRRYPNLVDNMRMAAKKTSRSKSSKAKKSGRKTSAKKTRKQTAKKTAKAKRRTSAKEKDPRGGMTAAGRKAFTRKQGAHLRPGVTKKASEMTPQEMRRKGSWAVRFARSCRRWSMPRGGRPDTRSPHMPGASLFPKPWLRPGALLRKASACWHATAASREKPSASWRARPRARSCR